MTRTAEEINEIQSIRSELMDKQHTIDVQYEIISEKDKEIERLKGLIAKMFIDGCTPEVKHLSEVKEEWEQFKKINQI